VRRERYGAAVVHLPITTDSDGGLGNRRMQHQGAFDLRGAEAVTGDVEHVVDPPRDPPVPIRIAARAVASCARVNVTPSPSAMLAA
jgi:hypothetical protein